MDKTVNCKWDTDEDLVVIYKIENILVFYSIDKDPNFKKGQLVSLEDVEKSNPYGAFLYWEDFCNWKER